MALSKGRTTQELHAGFVQPGYLYENEHGGGASLQVFDPSSLDFFFHKSHIKAMLEDSGPLGPIVDYSTTLSHQPSLSEPSNSSSSCGFTFGTPNSGPKEPQSVVRFKAAASDYSLCNVSMLNFEQEPQYNHLKLNYGEDSVSWADTIFPGHQVLHHNRRSGTDPRTAQEVNCFKGTSGYGAAVNGVKEHQREEEFGWVYPEEQHDDLLHGSRGAHKRPCMADEAPCSKRPSASNRKSKSKAVTSKDTQSIAAKNRRERITERLKILQALVPNGTKVDLVTMLEKAISYVKFLQLQVKVLSTDEFWPAHGGKAPEVAQVKEAIDAILSSHKERNFDAK